MIYQEFNIKHRESALKIAGNKPVSLREKNIDQTGMKVFKDGKVFSSSFFGQVKQQQDLIDQALENRHGALDQSYELPQALVKKEQRLSDNKNSKEELFQGYKETLAYLLKTYPNFIFSGDCKHKTTTRSLATNHGTNLVSEYEMSEWHFLYKDKNSANILDGYFGLSGLGATQIMDQTKAMHAFLKGYYKEVTIAPGDYPVMFASNDVLINKLEESIKIDRYHNESSLFKGRLGTKAVSGKINLIDTSYKPNHDSFNLFDGDGVVRDQFDLPIIENGCLNNLISNLRLAKKYQAPCTGNELRSYNMSTHLGAHKLYFLPGKQPMEKILSGFEKCIIVTMGAGGSFTSSGEFTTPVQQSFLAEYGNIVGRLPQLSLSSSFAAMLGDDFIGSGCHKTWFPHQEDPFLVYQMKASLH